MSQTNTALIYAIKQAQEEYPYYSRGFQALTFVPDERVPTMGVDKYWRVYYNPTWCTKNVHTLYNVVRHELEHLLRDHAGRRGVRGPELWNVACDMEINDELSPLPLGACLPDSINEPDHKTAEYYYSKIPPEQSGEGSGDEGEGSGVTGKPSSWELSPEDGDTPAVQQGEGETLKDAIADDIKSHASKDPGSVPGGIVIWAKARAKGKLPKIRWQNIVARRIREIVRGRQDFSYGMLSRRQNYGDRVMLPSPVAGLPSCALVVDTSGSMSELADWIAGCTNDVLRMFRNNAMLVDCDADVHQSRKLKHWRQITTSLGGGGTDMRAGIEYAQERLKSDVILVLTDGYTPWPDRMPKNVIPIIKQ